MKGQNYDSSALELRQGHLYTFKASLSTSTFQTCAWIYNEGVYTIYYYMYCYTIYYMIKSTIYNI